MDLVEWIGLALLGGLLVYIGYLYGSRQPREPGNAIPPARRRLPRPVEDASETRQLTESDAAVVRDLIVAKRHILAIKEVRDRTGCNLKMAKGIVDDMERRLGLRN